MGNEISQLSRVLKSTFEGGAWHGPSVKEAIDGVSAEEAQFRIPGTHSILELVGHMAAWRTYVIRKLSGDEGFRIDDAANFPVDKTWEQASGDLIETQRLLMSSLEGFSAEKLTEQVPGESTPLTFYTLIHGIIHHDVYHSGQIMLVRRHAEKQSI